MENIGEVALHVKGKMSTIYPVIGLGYGGRACACPPPARNASQREAGGKDLKGRALALIGQYV